MKKVLAALVLVFAVVGAMPLVGHAECADGGAAAACASESGVVLDGSADNADPFDGFISVGSDGSICASDDGAPGNDVEEDGECDYSF